VPVLTITSEFPCLFCHLGVHAHKMMPGIHDLTLQDSGADISAFTQASEQTVIAKQSFTLSKYFYHYVTHCKIVVNIA